MLCLITGKKSGRLTDPQPGCPRLPGHPLPFIPPGGGPPDPPTEMPPWHEEPSWHSHRHGRSVPCGTLTPSILQRYFGRANLPSERLDCAGYRGGMRRPQAGISSPGPPHGTLAPRRVLLPPGTAPTTSSPGTGQHFCVNISPLRLLRCTPTWPGSTQNCLLPANHKSPGNGAETTSKVWGSCRHRLRFWGLGGEAGGSSSGILNMPLLLEQLDEPTVMSLA